MSKSKWKVSKEIDGKMVRARMTRSEIVVRVEKMNDPEIFEEWDMPKFFGYDVAMGQAAVQTNFEDNGP